MRHGSLFSGIGGFDLAAEWMGWENVFHCEWMPFPRKVLKYYWPKAISYENICTTDFSVHRGQIDILTGGFPCQPYSSAGKRLGKEDERHLWPEMLRAIREIKPSWVVGENVRGLTNWNGGVVFEEVCADLESCGYEVQPILLPACAVNAPHRRDRIWFVAHSNNARTNIGLRGKSEWSENNGNWGFAQPESWKDDGNEYATDSDSKSIESEIESKRRISSSKWSKMGQKSSTNGKLKNASDTESERTRQQQQENRGRQNRRFNNDGEIWNASDTGSKRFQLGRISGQISEKKGISSKQRSEFGISSQAMGNGFKPNWENFPTQSPICNGDDGLSARLDSITFPKWRNESIKGGGNAIVPQVALQLFKVIQELSINK